MLDNFAKGLATLGVIEEIRKDPHQFEEMFVHYKNSIQASTVLDKVKLVTKDKTIQGLVTSFINNASHQGNNASHKIICCVVCVCQLIRLAVWLGFFCPVTFKIPKLG